MNPTPEQLAAINSQLQFNRRDQMKERNLSLIEETIAEWESIRPKDQAATEPLAFPDPPHGWGGWHNPRELTPGVVGIKDGWRLMLINEIIAMGDEFFNLDGFWQATSYDGMRLHPTCPIYRTKAPLPAPKPTPEEIERQEMDAVWVNYCIQHPGNGGRQPFEFAWKAAKKGLATP